ncbi:hypothetical protein [Psychrobacillus sp.]|uniref:hypothetical protein n=1 Tax=Psychrobacillus sp. TaxID=1871623 RepID=UPI0028BF1BFE|nr:hypothetical protein [Psychrobacillus sp.]
MNKKKKILSIGGIFIAGLLVGLTLMYNNSFYHTVNDVLGKGATQNSITNVSGVSSIPVNNMDLEAAMKAIQDQRAQLLETQLKDQISSVQEKNGQLAKLNTSIGEQRQILAQFPTDAVPNSPLNDDQLEAMKKAMEASGIGTEPPKTKEQLDALISQTKGNIDSLSNSQQMDMLRLQSLSNKRNEAFDVMSNFVKKMQENRSSIIGNMR